VAVDLGLALDRLGNEARGLLLLVYRVHLAPDDPEPSRFVTLNAAQLERKRVAIEQHRSQLHWHPRETFRFAQPREGFDLPGADFGPALPRGVRAAVVRGDDLVVDFARGRPFGLGPLVMRVVLQGPNGAEARLALALPPRPGVLEVRDLPGARAWPPARLEYAGDRWRLTLPLLGPGAPSVGYVKLERPRERALGFFDAAGWRRIGRDAR
jgi:hypothetical protein